MADLHYVPRVSGGKSIPFSWISACLFFVFFLDVSVAAGQSGAAWAQSLASTTYNAGSDVAVSPSGDVYFAGTFQEGFRLGDNRNDAMVSNGASDVWLTRMNSAGATIWMRTFGGAGEDRANRIVTDNKGNIYVTGNFESRLELDSRVVESRGRGDAFLAKFDASGALQWFKQAGGVGQDRGISLAVDDDGYVYWSGAFEGRAYFDQDQSVYKTSAGNSDAFIARYTPEGRLDWVESAGGINRDIATGLAVAPSGQVYIIGVTGHFTTVPREKIRGIYSGFEDIFIARYSSDGALDWMMYSGGFGFDAANGIAIDQQGYVYVTGYFETMAWFSSTNEQEEQFVGASFDIFLARYDHEGLLQWVRTAGGQGWDNAYDVSLDAAGYPYLAGLFRENFSMDGDERVYAAGEGESNAFLARFNTEGDLEGLQMIAGTKSEGFALDIDRRGAVYMTGSFLSEARFGTSLPALTSASTNTFMAMYPAVSFSTPPLQISQPPTEQPDDAIVQISNYPNPFATRTLVTFYLRETSAVRATVYDALGRIVQNMVYPSLREGTHRFELDLERFPAGIYFYSIQTPDFSSNHKMIKR